MRRSIEDGRSRPTDVPPNRPIRKPPTSDQIPGQVETSRVVLRFVADVIERGPATFTALEASTVGEVALHEDKSVSVEPSSSDDPLHVDVSRTMADSLLSSLCDVAAAPFKAFYAFGSGLVRSFGRLFSGDLGGAAVSFATTLKDAGVQLLGGILDAGIRIFAALSSSVSTLLGLESVGRTLSESERPRFKDLFGASVDLDLVRIKRGGPLTLGASKTIGDTIYLADACFDASGQLNDHGRATLDHEMGHVWQHQNGGDDYMHASLLAQASAFVTGGSRNGAYDWRTALGPPRRPFAELNPEQQASLIGALAGWAERDASTGQGGGLRFSAVEADYLREALVQVRAGAGAP